MVDGRGGLREVRTCSERVGKGIEGVRLEKVFRLESEPGEVRRLLELVHRWGELVLAFKLGGTQGKWWVFASC